MTREVILLLIFVALISADCPSAPGGVCGGSLKGRCIAGNCVCLPGWTGIDCSSSGAVRGCPVKHGAECSGHGTCLDGACVCSSLYVGDDCSKKLVEVGSGEMVWDRVTRGSYVFYGIVVPSTAVSLAIQLNQTARVGAGTLLVKYGSMPTIDDYDQIADTNDKNLAITIYGNDLRYGTYYIGVFGAVDAVSYYLMGTWHTLCPNDCSGHGECQQSTCVCDAGYVGSDCSKTVAVTISAKQPIQGSLTQGTWNYYAYQASSGEYQYFVRVKRHSPSGSGRLYLRFNSLPYLESYDFYTEQQNQDGIMILQVVTPSPGMWYAGVYADTDFQYTISIDSDPWGVINS